MCLPIHNLDEHIDSAETLGYVPGLIETVMQFDPGSSWSAGVITNCSTTQSQSTATRCAVLIPREGAQSRLLALHPALPSDVIKAMLNAR